ncbi:MAG: DNA repair protein RecO [Bacteroidetes bacterium]|nr:DNA repair protein RecO [Bacteroidota bacterium]
MLYSTRGIILHTVKYSETSLIAKIYTETFGLQSYMVKGIRSRKSKIRTGLFQPLGLNDLVVYHKEKSSLQTIKEIQSAFPYKSVPFDINKSSVALFIDELIFKSIREEEKNEALFDFLWNACIILDTMTTPVAYFHLWFSVHLTAYLGFMPHMNLSERNKWFNLHDGTFQESIPLHPEYMDETETRLFSQLMKISSSGLTSLTYSRDTRNRLLDKILTFYIIHLPGFTGLRSHHILQTILE